jgi:hypothetical protein
MKRDGPACSFDDIVQSQVLGFQDSLDVREDLLGLLSSSACVTTHLTMYP